VKIQWLGTGSAFTNYLKNWQTSALITLPNGYKLLFDCGSDTKNALVQAGIDPISIDAIYISHLHGDHIGGMEYLGFMNYFMPESKGQPDLYIHNSLAGRLWQALAPGMESIQNQTNTLDIYFEVQRIEKNGTFELFEYGFKPIQVTHIVNDATIEPAFGLMITTPEGKKIFLTSDTQDSPSQLRNFYESADVIYHDCETLPFCTGVHSNFMEMSKLPAADKAKMRLVHFQDNVVDEPDVWRLKAEAAGFGGFVMRGEEFTH